MSQKILLTAFEPFDGRSKNASAEALRLLSPQLVDHPRWQVCTRLLPVETGRVSDVLRAAIDSEHPDVVLCLGEAKREHICLEQVAHNQRRYTIPDNAGNLVDDVPIDPVGLPRYEATLPLQVMLSAMQHTGTPVRLSDNAGRYLCNEAMYSVLQHIDLNRLPARAGFIHVPHLPREAADPQYPTLPTATVVAALAAGLEGL